MENSENFKTVLMESCREVLTANLSMAPEKEEDSQSVTIDDGILVCTYIDGAVSGNMMLALAKETVSKIFSKMFGREITEINQEALEVARKLLSLIAAKVAESLSKQSMNVHCGTPVICQGKDVKVCEAGDKVILSKKIGMDGIEFSFSFVENSGSNKAPDLKEEQPAAEQPAQTPQGGEPKGNDTAQQPPEVPPDNQEKNKETPKEEAKEAPKEEPKESSQEEAPKAESQEPLKEETQEAPKEEPKESVPKEEPQGSAKEEAQEPAQDKESVQDSQAQAKPQPEPQPAEEPKAKEGPSEPGQPQASPPAQEQQPSDSPSAADDPIKKLDEVIKKYKTAKDKP